MFCTRCGKEIPEGAASCPYCGSEAARAAGGAPPPQPPRGAAPTPQPPAGASPSPQPPDSAVIPPPPAAPMPGRGSKRLLLAAVAVAVVLAVAAGTAIPLLLAGNGEEAPRHGIKVTLRALGEPSIEDLLKAVDIVRARLEYAGIDGAEVDAEGDDSVVVRIQGAADTDRLLEVIGKTAQLQFREVLEVITPEDERYGATEVTVADPEDLEAYRALRDREIVLAKEMVAGDSEKEMWKLRLGPIRLTGDIIETADAAVDEEGGGFKIVFELTEEATRDFADLTTELQGKNLAIVVDYTVESFPLVNMPIIEGKGEITGDFTREEARDLALLLKLGALPVEFEPQPQVEAY